MAAAKAVPHPGIHSRTCRVVNGGHVPCVGRQGKTLRPDAYDPIRFLSAHGWPFRGQLHIGERLPMAPPISLNGPQTTNHVFQPAASTLLGARHRPDDLGA
jgi:hypothetical protein